VTAKLREDEFCAQLHTLVCVGLAEYGASVFVIVVGGVLLLSDDGLQCHWKASTKCASGFEYDGGNPREDRGWICL